MTQGLLGDKALATMILHVSFAYWAGRVQRTLGLAPLAWWALLGLVAGASALHLNHWPRYDQDPDPKALSAWLGALQLAEFVGFMLAGLAAGAWAVLTAALLVVAPRTLRANAGVTMFCAASIVAFFWLRAQHPGLLQWLSD